MRCDWGLVTDKERWCHAIYCWIECVDWFASLDVGIRFAWRSFFTSAIPPLLELMKKKGPSELFSTLGFVFCNLLRGGDSSAPVLQQLIQSGLIPMVLRLLTPEQSKDVLIEMTWWLCFIPHTIATHLVFVFFGGFWRISAQEQLCARMLWSQREELIWSLVCLQRHREKQLYSFLSCVPLEIWLTSSEVLFFHSYSSATSFTTGCWTRWSDHRDSLKHQFFGLPLEPSRKFRLRRSARIMLGFGKSQVLVMYVSGIFLTVLVLALRV